MRETKNDAGLAEVKAVLRQLQRLDGAVPGGTEAPASPEVASADNLGSGGRSVLAAFDKRATAVSAAPALPRGRKGTRFIVSIAALLLAAAGAVLAVASAGRGIFYSFGHRTAEAPRALGGASGTANTAALLSEVRRLLDDGHIVNTRRFILRQDPGNTAELAFVLAQSYDPNYLRSVPKPDAPGDRKEAERWYRAWYGLAAGRGLDMDKDRFQRIIDAMQ